MSDSIIQINKDDLLAAWAVLENLAVSFDQIGGTFGRAPDCAEAAEDNHHLEGAVLSYLTPQLIAAIADARTRIGRYVPDREAEALSEQIAYWDYQTAPQALDHPS